MDSSQDDTIGFLIDALGANHADVSRHDTHISTVVLARDRVFKLKRPVKLPYVDFSTPERRHAACQDEFRLNVRTAPGLYLGVRRITTGQDGRPEFDGDGPLVDAVVEMRRFNQRNLFDRMAGESRLTSDHVRLLACRIARFHAGIEPDAVTDGADAIRFALDINARALSSAAIFAPAAVRDLIETFDVSFERHRPVLTARSRDGRVRRCHGDLHLGNICLFEGTPTAFDCLEFSPELATTDVLYDLAFLLMDLWHRRLPLQANIAFNRYLDESGDDAALAVMPFFMAIRAAVRAHVQAARAAGQENADARLIASAKGYFDLARALLLPAPPRLVAIGGMSGSGKSTVARLLAPEIGAPPGARIVSTDRVRKALSGVSAATRLPAEAYLPAVSVQVYKEQRRSVARVLTGGHAAIADGVFLQRYERQAIARVARKAGVRFDGLWLNAPKRMLVARVETRTADPSDATSDVVEIQSEKAQAPLEWSILCTGRALPDILREAARILGQSEGPAPTGSAGEPTVVAGPETSGPSGG